MDHLLSYEDSLEDFLAALKDENSVINTWLDDLDHIFIDEAQSYFWCAQRSLFN